MSNLIPQIAKKKIATEYWLRVSTAWFLLWAAALIVAAVLLFPVYIFTATQVAVSADSARGAEALVADHEAIGKKIEAANDQARLVIENARLSQAHSIVGFFESMETSSVSFSKITFTKSGTTVQPIRLTGQASDRESLAAFRDALLAHEAVATVDLPISNLAKDKDILFDITVTMHKNSTL